MPLGPNYVDMDPTPTDMDPSDPLGQLAGTIDRIAAWRRAGSPDNEEGQDVQALEEDIRRRVAETRGRGA